MYSHIANVEFFTASIILHILWFLGQTFASDTEPHKTTAPPIELLDLARSDCDLASRRSPFDRPGGNAEPGRRASLTTAETHVRQTQAGVRSDLSIDTYVLWLLRHPSAMRRPKSSKHTQNKSTFTVPMAIARVPRRIKSQVMLLNICVCVIYVSGHHAECFVFTWLQVKVKCHKMDYRDQFRVIWAAKSRLWSVCVRECICMSFFFLCEHALGNQFTFFAAEVM